jgi:hypothetical protein
MVSSLIYPLNAHPCGCREVRDADDLIDTLTRIAAQEANNDSAGSFSFASAPEKGDFPKSNVATPGSSVRSDHGEEEEEGAEDGLLNADDQHTVVGILTRYDYSIL